jgi:ATP-dependent Lon protease
MKRCHNRVEKLISEVDSMVNINRPYRTEVVDELKDVKKIIVAKMNKPSLVTDNGSDLDPDYKESEDDDDNDDNEYNKNNDNNDDDNDDYDDDDDDDKKSHFSIGRALRNSLTNALSNGVEAAFLNKINESLKPIVEKIKELRKINGNEDVASDFNNHCKDMRVPGKYDILKMEHVMYEEKKDLLDLLDIYENCECCTIENLKDKKEMRDQLNFRFRNLRNIRGKSQREKYKRSREAADISYREILRNENITDDEAAHLIQRVNIERKNLSDNYDSGVVSLKRARYELVNGGHEESMRIDLYKKIKESSMPDQYKKKLYFMLSSSGEDEYKPIEFVKLAVQLPFNKIQYDVPNTMAQMYSKFKYVLDQQLYGMDKIKEELITSVCCKLFTNDAKFKAIALVGPAGTGKSTIARAIATVFNIPFQQLSMSAISNGSDLSGHNYTYTGSQPGRIAKALMDMKCNNGVVFLDELDKVNDSPHDSVQNVLMNILDSSQNNEFVDNYFQDFKIDLSNILFVCSLNNANKLNYILSDRIKLIQVNGYSQDEKVEICKIMIGKIMNQLQLNDIYFNDDVIRYLIKKDDEINKLSGEENTGVRGVESIIKHILERLKVLVSTIDRPLSSVSYLIQNFQLPYHLNNNDVNLLLLNYGVSGRGRMDVLEKVNNSLIPLEGKQKLREMLANTSEYDGEYHKVMDFISQALKIPFNKIKYNIPDSVSELYHKFKNLLDKELYGMEKVKEELITSICCKVSKDDVKYKAIALAGPPGTGKTTIARSIAKVFNVPFEQISMNSISHGSDLTGHSYTYSGSQPGRLTKALMKMKCNNGVLFLDEIDKIYADQEGNHQRDGINDALMSILDSSQNYEFSDNYFQDFKIDLSNLLIVCSLNDIHKLDKIIVDRIKVIKVKGYELHEKREITKNMIKKTAQEFDIDLNNIRFSDHAIAHIIHKAEEHERNLGKMKHEGVRAIESAIKHIMERFKILIDTIDIPLSHISYRLDGFNLPYTVTQDSIEKLLKNFMADDEMADVRHMYM